MALEDGLLRKGDPDGGGGCGDSVSDGDRRQRCGWAAEFGEEGKRLGYVAAPMVAVMLAQYLVQVISTMMVGHLGELPLAGASIGVSLSSVTGFSLLMGLACGLETLCGQAYGAKQYQKLGVHLYRAIFILFLVCIPITVLWLNLSKLLVLVRQDPDIAREAGRFVVWLIPALFGYGAAQPLIKFLQAQSLILPMLFSAIASLLIHVPLCWVLVFRTGLGSRGAALAIGVSYWLNVVILALYVRYSDACKATRAPLTKDAFRGIKEFLRLALPSAVMICLEWWSFEFLILLSGLLPNPQLETSVLAICLNTIATLYTVPYGLGAAASTRVSNELGAGNPHAARLAVQVSMTVAVTEAFIVGLAIVALRNVFGYAFSNEKEVIDYVKKMAPLLSLSVVMDSLQGVLSGIARGCGWQHLGAYVNLGSFYIFGIPIAAALGFWENLRGQGLWIGVLTGATIQTVLISLITIFTNWQHQQQHVRVDHRGDRHFGIYKRGTHLMSLWDSEEGI